MKLLVDNGLVDSTVFMVSDEKGEFRHHSRLKGGLRQQCETLLLTILKQKPKKIMFDTAGAGRTFKDAFIDLSEDILRIEENGNIQYL